MEQTEKSFTILSHTDNEQTTHSRAFQAWRIRPTTTWWASLMPTGPGASLLSPTATPTTSMINCAQPSWHTWMMTPRSQMSAAVWIVETTWQVCHVVFVQVSTYFHPPFSSHTRIQRPCCQQGDMATIRMVQHGNNKTHHNDTTTN